MMNQSAHYVPKTVETLLGSILLISLRIRNEKRTKKAKKQENKKTNRYLTEVKSFVVYCFFLFSLFCRVDFWALLTFAGKICCFPQKQKTLELFVFKTHNENSKKKQGQFWFWGKSQVYLKKSRNTSKKSRNTKKQHFWLQSGMLFVFLAGVLVIPSIWCLDNYGKSLKTYSPKHAKERRKY